MPPAAPSVTKVFGWGLYLPQGVQFELAICSGKIREKIE
jgi:hypothetical protein